MAAKVELMRLRLLLGPVMILLLVLGVWLDHRVDTVALPGWISQKPGATWPPGSVIFIFVLGITIVAARELAGILGDKGILSSKRISTFAAVMGLLVSCMIPTWVGTIDAVAIGGTSAMLVLMTALLFFSRHKTVEGVIAATGGALLAYVYLGLMFGFLLAIRREHTVWALLWTLFSTKACDIGAYFIGKAFGRHKLISWLSPGKTWEGLAGGVILSCIVGAAAWEMVAHALRNPPGWWAGAVAAGLFALIGQAGDLLESMLKRDAGIKDSGRTVPGFGGVLDVIDSPLLVGPFAYWWLRLLDEGPW